VRILGIQAQVSERCTSSSGRFRLVTFRLLFDSHRGSFASNLEQVANLLCAQVNSASYPQWDGKWVVAYGLRGEGLVWLIGPVVCLLAVSWCGQWMAASHSALRYH